MHKAEAEIGKLVEAMDAERLAACQLKGALDGVRGCFEQMDPTGQRRLLAEAKDAYDELLRSASLRNSLAGRVAVSLGLKREVTVADIIDRLEARGTPLDLAAIAMAEELERVQGNMAVLGLVAKYGSAMTSSLMEIRGANHQNVPYGRNGHRTAAYTRMGRTA